MIKYILSLCLFLFLRGTGFASVESPTQLQNDIFWNGRVYHEYMEQHRLEFLGWIASHGLWNSYDRVITTVSCRDADYIPKCPDAGKVFFSDNGSYQLMHNGVKVLKDCYGSWETDLIYGLKGHHEPQEEKLFYEVLKYVPPHGVMIELGSYWAYYSLWFHKAIPNAKNYLIEPDPERLNIGEQNFALNDAKGSFFRGYVGERNVDSGDCQGASQILIDSFLKDNNIDHVDILHSDIQGAEYGMLQSALQSIQAKKINYFFISTHSELLHADCLKFLKSHNYEILAEHSPAESFSVDGLIVGKRNDLVGCGVVPITKLKRFLIQRPG